MNNEQIFYMVFIEGGNNPEKRHGRQSDAENECKRLVKKTKRKGYVLQSIKSIELYPEFLENDFIEDLPF